MEDSIAKFPVKIFPCLSWISFVFEELIEKIISKKSIPYLPDEIIINILSRLLVTDVLQRQRVCKTWKALISTKSFIDLHLKQTTPILIAQFIREVNSETLKIYEIEETELCLVEDWRVKSKHNKYKKCGFGSIVPLGQGQPNILQLSYNGLLVFRPRVLDRVYAPAMKSFIICNPVTNQKITLTLCDADICGIFFHPQSREYMVLCFEYDDEFSYKIGSLKPQSSSWRHAASISYSPRVSSPPVLLNLALHWNVFGVLCNGEYILPNLSESILVFNIVSEDFSVKPYPEDTCESNAEHCQKDILEMQEHLAVFEFHIFQQEMHLFVLEDYANWFWTKRYTICFEIDLENNPFRVTEQVIPLGVLDGELLIHWRTRGLFCYHLKKGTIRRYRWPERDDYHCTSCSRIPWRERDCDYGTHLSIYTGSFIDSRGFISREEISL